MKIKFLLLASLFMLFFSCKDDCDEPMGEPVNESFYPLTVGSNWSYQWYRVDTLGNEEIIGGKEDTIRVIGDTLINSNLYAIIADNNIYEFNSTRIYYRRDSSGYLVDEKGEIFFTDKNFVDVLSQFVLSGSAEIKYRMDIPVSPIVTPAGEFECLNFRGEVIPSMLGSWDKKYLNNYYSKGVGLVHENTFFFLSGIDLERRLIDYHIE